MKATHKQKDFLHHSIHIGFPPLLPSRSSLALDRKSGVSQVIIRCCHVLFHLLLFNNNWLYPMISLLLCKKFSLKYPLSATMLQNKMLYDDGIVPHPPCLIWPQAVYILSIQKIPYHNQQILIKLCSICCYQTGQFSSDIMSFSQTSSWAKITIGLWKYRSHPSAFWYDNKLELGSIICFFFLMLSNDADVLD